MLRLCRCWTRTRHVLHSEPHHRGEDQQKLRLWFVAPVLWELQTLRGDQVAGTLAVGELWPANGRAKPKQGFADDPPKPLARGGAASARLAGAVKTRPECSRGTGWLFVRGSAESQALLMNGAGVMIPQDNHAAVTIR